MDLQNTLDTNRLIYSSILALSMPQEFWLKYTRFSKQRVYRVSHEELFILQHPMETPIGVSNAH